MTYPLAQQIEAVRLVVAEKRGAGEVTLAEALEAALHTLTGGVPQASPTLYKQFEAEYKDWHLRITNPSLEARMDGGQGRALHAIISYLRSHCTAKDDAGALASWKYVLANWSKAPAFIQRQTALTAINKYLTEIMLAIKKANQPVARAWPDVWSDTFAGKLTPEELSAYRAHLRARGWRYDGQRQMWISPK